MSVPSMAQLKYGFVGTGVHACPLFIASQKWYAVGATSIANKTTVLYFQQSIDQSV